MISGIQRMKRIGQTGALVVTLGRGYANTPVINLNGGINNSQIKINFLINTS